MHARLRSRGQAPGVRQHRQGGQGVVDIDAELNVAPWIPNVTRTDGMTMLLQIAAGDIRQLTDKPACSYAHAESCRPAGIDHPAGVASWPWGRSRSHRLHVAHRSRPGNRHTVITQRGHRPPGYRPWAGRTIRGNRHTGGTPSPGAGRANGPVPQPWIWNGSPDMTGQTCVGNGLRDNYGYRARHALEAQAS